MNPVKAILFIAGLMVASVGAEEEPSSLLRFSNGDQLGGKLEGLSRDLLVWTSPDLEKPNPFFLKRVLDVTLAPNEPEVKAKHEATVTLTNGDVVRGQLAGMAPESITLDTWFAGRLVFTRPMIKDVKLAERQDLLYRGPTGLEGWKVTGKPSWTYRNSTFRSAGTGTLSRQMDLPAEFSLAFNAEWRSAFNLRLAFFTGDIDSENKGGKAKPGFDQNTGYEIVFQRRMVYARSRKSGMSLGNGNPSTSAVFAESEKARIEIRASSKSGKICLLVDGEMIEVWTDPDFAGAEFGKAIQFISSQNDSPVQISRIEMSQWDGHIDREPERAAHLGHEGFGMEEEAAPKPPTPAEPEPHRMQLRNGDSIVGEVLAIGEGTITVKTPFREVKLPLESLSSVALAPAEYERCKREAGDVRGWFPDGSSIVFRLDGAGDGVLQGSSQNFGKAEFKADAFSRIEFNIYEADFDELRVAGGW